MKNFKSLIAHGNQWQYRKVVNIGWLFYSKPEIILLWDVWRPDNGTINQTFINHLLLLNKNYNLSSQLSKKSSKYHDNLLSIFTFKLCLVVSAMFIKMFYSGNKTLVLDYTLVDYLPKVLYIFLTFLVLCAYKSKKQSPFCVDLV